MDDSKSLLDEINRRAGRFGIAYYVCESGVIKRNNKRPKDVFIKFRNAQERHNYLTKLLEFIRLYRG